LLAEDVKFSNRIALFEQKQKCIAWKSRCFNYTCYILGL